MPKGKKTTPQRQAAGQVVNEQLSDEVVLRMYSKINRTELNTKEKFIDWVISQLRFNQAEVDMKNLRERIWRRFFAGGTSANAGTLARVQHLANTAAAMIERQEKIDAEFKLPYAEFVAKNENYKASLEESAKRLHISPERIYARQQKNVEVSSEENRKKWQAYISVAEQYKIRNDFWSPETSTAQSAYRHDALDMGDVPNILDLLSEIG